MDPVGLDCRSHPGHPRRADAAHRAHLDCRRHRFSDRVAAWTDRLAYAKVAGSDLLNYRNSLHRPFPGIVRVADPVHRADHSDGRDRTRQLHAVDFDPQHRGRHGRRPTRGARGGPRDGISTACRTVPDRHPAGRPGHHGGHPDRHRDDYWIGHGHRSDRRGRPRQFDSGRIDPGLQNAARGGHLALDRSGHHRGCRPGRPATPGHALVPGPGEDMTFLGQALQWFLDGSHWQGDFGIPNRLFEHLTMSGISLLAAAVIALPIGITLGHFGRGGNLAINVSNVGRAIPSFAILVLAVQLVGIGALLVALLSTAGELGLDAAQRLATPEGLRIQKYPLEAEVVPTPQAMIA